MICSGRLDDLSMVHAGMTALLAACDKPSKHTRVLAIFDNEETARAQSRAQARRFSSIYSAALS